MCEVLMNVGDFFFLHYSNAGRWISYAWNPLRIIFTNLIILVLIPASSARVVKRKEIRMRFWNREDTKVWFWSNAKHKKCRLPCNPRFKFENRIPMIKPISIFFRNGVASQFLTITFKTFAFKSVYFSKGNRNLHDISRFKALSHGERCVERRYNATNGKLEPSGPFTHKASELCSNATYGKIRTLYILMMYSHCRVTTRIATVIARIGHVSNLTTYIDLTVWQ